MASSKRFQVAVFVLVGFLCTVVPLAIRRVWQNRLEIGPETTVLSGPLTPYGIPDYISELNRIGQEGVTAENNAAVKLLEIVEVSPQREEALQVLLKVMGLTRSPDGPRLKRISPLALEEVGGSLDQQNQDSGKVRDEAAEACLAPWKAGSYPYLERWISKNEAMLEVLVEGSKRSRYFIPQRSGLPFYSRSELADTVREIHLLLLTTAMREYGEGRLEHSGELALSAYRWSLRLRTSVWYGDRLVSNSMSSTAAMTLARILEAEVAGPFLDRWESEFQETTCNDDSAEIENRASRYEHLNLFLLPIAADEKRPPSEDEKKTDWREVNLCLRQINHIIDRFVVLLRTPSYPKRLHEIEAIALEPVDSSLPLTRGDYQVFETWRSIYRSITGSEARIQARRRLLELEFALAKYRRDNKSWPEKLEALTPKYVATIPIDPCTDTANWIYRKTETGFDLYSPGLNEVDELIDIAMTGHRGDDFGLFEIQAPLWEDEESEMESNSTEEEKGEDEEN